MAETMPETVTTILLLGQFNLPVLRLYPGQLAVQKPWHMI